MVDISNSIFESIFANNTYDQRHAIIGILQVNYPHKKSIQDAFKWNEIIGELDTTPVIMMNNLQCQNHYNTYERFMRINHFITQFNLNISVSNLFNFTSLDLSHRNLTCFPIGLCDLINLTQLNISYNQIYEIPNEIINLRNLVRLDISYNNLGLINNGLTCLPNLLILFLYGNDINLERCQIEQLFGCRLHTLSCNNNSTYSDYQNMVLNNMINTISNRIENNLTLTSNVTSDYPFDYQSDYFLLNNN